MRITLFLLLVLLLNAKGQSLFEVTSPDGASSAVINIKDTIRMEVKDHANILLSALAAIKVNQSWLGIQSKLMKANRKSVSETIIHPTPTKRRVIPVEYNELELQFKEKFSFIIRLYNDGAAYRFRLNGKDSVVIQNEISDYVFDAQQVAFMPEVKKREGADIFHTSFEEQYTIKKINEFSDASVGFSPILIEAGNDKVFLTESDLLDYPGMFFQGTRTGRLKGIFSGYPEKEEIQGEGFRQKVVVKRHNYIARTSGNRSLPWRVIGIARHDAELLMNDIVYRLASAPRNQDWSWVVPGQCTDEWICGINLYNVPFKAGINTATYKYYIDFAKRFGIEYVMLDAGWSDNEDLFKITPGLDLEAIARYAQEQGVGLCLWTLALTLDKQMEPAFMRFKELGIKFIMTDFMDRDDQRMNNFYQHVAEAGARNKIMLMYHGAYKNAGFERTYPNVLTREGVLGSEYNIWSDKATPEHDLHLPFIRMTAGPFDYEPGFFENATKDFFKANPERVMSQGTRCHQLAMFVVYESPFQVFSGNPSDAEREPAFMSFLGSIPTTWDETRVIEARLGDYVVIARRKGNDWFIAGMTDWTPRKFELDLSFIEVDMNTIEGYVDGPNAERNPRDYQLLEQPVVNLKKTIPVELKPGGGFVLKVKYE